MRLQLFATQLALLPFALLDWGQSPAGWRGLAATIGLYALVALPLGLIGGAFERLWRPMGLGLAPTARQNANRIGFLVGLAATIGLQAAIIWWSQRFNAKDLAALLAAMGLIPAGLVGIAVGLVARRITQPWLPTSTGRNTTWLAVLGLAATIGLIAHRAQRPDLWATVHLPLLPFLPLLPVLWIAMGQRIRALDSKPRWLVNILPLPILFFTLWLPGVASEVVRSEGLMGPVVLGLRQLGDGDQDGFSMWLGGGDCDDANGSISPGAFDRPHDGVDQDCDGADFAPKPADKRQQFKPLPESMEPLRNLLLITVDTLRADRLSWHDSPNDTMPQTQKLLVERGMAFKRAYANGVRSQRSIPSMVIGRYPSRLAWGETGRDAVTVADANLTLGELLQKSDFDTHAVIMERYFAKQSGLTQGWQYHRSHSIQPRAVDWSKSTSGAISSYTVRLIKRLQKGDDRWAVWVHYYDPHIRFARSRFGHDAAARYDESLAVTDEELAPLLEAVDLDNTLVVLASDHGQGLNSHGHHGHGSHLYEEAVHVPLIFAGSGIQKGENDRVVQNIDIVPTVANLLDLHHPLTQWDGRSLVPALVGDPLPRQPAYTEALPDPHTNDHAWAVIDDKEKLIHDLKLQTLSYFNLDADPDEQRPLEPKPGAGQALLRALNAHRATAAWINHGDYGGPKTEVIKPPSRRPDRIEGSLQVELGQHAKLTHFALLDPPRAGARLRLRLNVEALKDFGGRLNAMVHIDGATSGGDKIFLNRDQPITPEPDWKTGDRREVMVDFLMPRNAKGGQVTVYVGLYPPGHKKWKATGRAVDARGRIATARFTLR